MSTENKRHIERLQGIRDELGSRGYATSIVRLEYHPAYALQIHLPNEGKRRINACLVQESSGELYVNMLSTREHRLDSEETALILEHLNILREYAAEP